MAIVLIEPNDSDLRETERMLREFGYTDVHGCRGFPKAFELLSIDNNETSRILYGVELFIMDISQGPDAIDGAEKIRETYRYQDIPVLMVSSGPPEEKIRTAFAFGAADFMSKPVQHYELQARVRACLRLKHEIERRKAREKELIEATHQLSDLNRLLTRVSLVDSLTTIANRRCFDQSLNQEWRRAFRNSSQLSVIMLDVDYFKQFNDTYGHQAGDDCLKRVARLVNSKLHRPGDLLARYGGEEFAVILPDTSASDAGLVGENIRKAVERAAIPHRTSKISEFITISLGVAAATPNSKGASEAALLKEADEALYEAKNSGRNRVYVSERKTRKAS